MSAHVVSQLECTFPYFLAFPPSQPFKAALTCRADIGVLLDFSMLNPHVALKSVQLEERKVLAKLTLELYTALNLHWMLLVNVSLQVQHLLKLPLVRAGIAEEWGICSHLFNSWSDHLLLQSSSNLNPVARILLNICVLLGDVFRQLLH